MSSTILKKAKKASKTRTKQPISEFDPAPVPSSKERKPKPTKPEERVDKTKSKLAKGEGRKSTTAEETRRDSVPAARKRVDPSMRLARKPRGPWRAPSSSPSPTSDLEPSHTEEDGQEASSQEGSDDAPSDENIHLYGFSTDEDSSDDDLDVGEEADLDLASLPTVARDDATVKRKLEKAKRKPVRRILLSLPTYCSRPVPTGVRNGRGLSQPNSARLL
jgi:nucleolar protein 15